MKKALVILTLLFFVLACGSAGKWRGDVSLGFPGGIGAGYASDPFELDISIRTTYGVGGILSYSFLDKVTDTSMTAEEKFRYGNCLIHGLSAAMLWKAFGNDTFSFLAGPDVSALHFSSREGVISHFTEADLVLFNLSVKLDWTTGKHSGFFLNAAFPFLLYLSYGGDASDPNNYSPFDFWALVPKALFELEEGGWVDVKASTLSILLCALDFRAGFSYWF